MKYTEDRIERLLSEALAAQTPDVFRQVAEAEITPEIVFEPAVRLHTRRRAVSKVCAALAACAVLACSAGGYAYFRTDAVVGIDVNPSIELRLNRFERVLAAEAKNEDAAAVLDGMELRNTTVDTAVSAIVGALLRHDYLQDDAAVLVTVTGRDGDRRAALETRIVADIEEALPEREKDLPVYVQDEAAPPPAKEPVQAPQDAPQAEPTPEPQKPAQTGKPPETSAPPAQAVTPPAQQKPPQEPEKPSHGKQLLIDQLRAADSSLDEAALARMSVKQLCELADELDIDLYNAGGQKLDDDGKPEDEDDDRDDHGRGKDWDDDDNDDDEDDRDHDDDRHDDDDDD